MKIDINKITTYEELLNSTKDIIKKVELEGEVVVFKDNKPSYVLTRFDYISEQTKFTADNKDDYITLHDAMELVLAETEGHQMHAAQLADIIYDRNLYRQKDGGKAVYNQIRARSSHYPGQFEALEGNIIKLVTGFENDEYSNVEDYKNWKIGKIVRTVLKRLLESDNIPESEITLLQDKIYSKKTFDIQYPVLVKAKYSGGSSPRRYYSTPLMINGEEYFLCSEWFEVPANNDKPYLMKWLEEHKRKQNSMQKARLQ